MRAQVRKNTPKREPVKKPLPRKKIGIKWVKPIPLPVKPKGKPIPPPFRRKRGI